MQNFIHPAFPFHSDKTASESAKEAAQLVAICQHAQGIYCISRPAMAIRRITEQGDPHREAYHLEDQMSVIQTSPRPKSMICFRPHDRPGS